VGGGDELLADSPTKVRGTRPKTYPELEGPRRVMRGPFFMPTHLCQVYSAVLASQARN